MSKSFHPLLAIVQQLLADLGQRIKLARQRRKIKSADFAMRIGISRDTLNRLEKGEATISIGTYMKALHVLGLANDIELVAKDDVLGRKLQDAGLLGARAKSVKTKEPDTGRTAPTAHTPEELRQKNLVFLRQMLGTQDNANGAKGG